MTVGLRCCLIWIVTWLIPAFAFSQNLVPNAGFEKYKRIPCYLNGYSVQDVLENWFQPLVTTTDYWHTDSPEDCNMNPATITETPRTGKGAVGIIIADVFNGPSGLQRSRYQEYVAVELLRPVAPGKLYRGEFYTKVKSREFSPDAPIIRSNNLGMAFTDSLIRRTSIFDTVRAISLDMQVVSEKAVGPEWERVNECFSVEKQGSYLYMGNFKNIGEAKIEGSLAQGKNGYAYYFLDDILVEEMSYNVSALQTEVRFCDAPGLGQLDAFVAGATGYLWDDGTTGSSKKVMIHDKSQHSVTISFKECDYHHTFNLADLPGLDLGNDTTLCSGEEIRLFNKARNSPLIWSDGSEESIRVVNASGVYTARTVDGDCAIEDSIEISVIDCPGFVPNIITANGDRYNHTLIAENIYNRVWSLTVFNRWGIQVYRSDHYKNDWQGDDLPVGVYYYKLECVQMKKVVNGWVEVLR